MAKRVQNWIVYCSRLCGIDKCTCESFLQSSLVYICSDRIFVYIVRYVMVECGSLRRYRFICGMTAIFLLNRVTLRIVNCPLEKPWTKQNQVKLCSTIGLTKPKIQCTPFYSFLCPQQSQVHPPLFMTLYKVVFL